MGVFVLLFSGCKVIVVFVIVWECEIFGIISVEVVE